MVDKQAERLRSWPPFAYRCKRAGFGANADNEHQRVQDSEDNASRYR